MVYTQRDTYIYINKISLKKKKPSKCALVKYTRAGFLVFLLSGPVYILFLNLFYYFKLSVGMCVFECVYVHVSTGDYGGQRR
jgi:hypothetical protein